MTIKATEIEVDTDDWEDREGKRRVVCLGCGQEFGDETVNGDGPHTVQDCLQALRELAMTTVGMLNRKRDKGS